MKIVECDELSEGKTVMIEDIIFVGTKTDGVKINQELRVEKMAI